MRYLMINAFLFCSISEIFPFRKVVFMKHLLGIQSSEGRDSDVGATIIGEQESQRPLAGDSRKASVEISVKTSVKILRRLEANSSMMLGQIVAKIERSLRAVEFARAKVIKEGIRYVGQKKGGQWEVLKRARLCSPVWNDTNGQGDGFSVRSHFFVVHPSFRSR